MPEQLIGFSLGEWRQKKKTQLFCYVLFVGGLRSGMRHAVRRCSRWHVGGLGWRKRESVCGQSWLIAIEQQSPFQQGNDASVHLGGGLQLFSSSWGHLLWEQRTPPQKPNAPRTKQICDHTHTVLKICLQSSHLSVSLVLCNKNKMSLDSVTLRAVNIPQLIRLRFNQQHAVTGASHKSCCLGQIFTRSWKGTTSMSTSTKTMMQRFNT